MSRTFTLAALVILVLSMPVVLAQDGKDALVAGVNAKIPGKLEAILTAALESNPDVLLALAKVREADAALNQVRLEVVQRASELYHERKRHQAARGFLRTEYQRTKRLVENGVVEVGKVHEISLQQAEADASLARIEAEIRYVIGAGGRTRTVSDRPFVRGTTDTAKAPPTLPRPPLEEAGVTRQMLATLEVAWKETPIGQVVADLQKATGGELAFVLHGSTGPGDYEITLSLPGKVEVAHVLSALADQLQGGICFVFRDYGVLVVETDYAQHLDGATIPAGIPLLRK